MIPNQRSAQQKVADFSDKIMLQKKRVVTLSKLRDRRSSFRARFSLRRTRPTISVGDRNQRDRLDPPTPR
jgi:hypothetical protein